MREGHSEQNTCPDLRPPQPGPVWAVQASHVASVAVAGSLPTDAQAAAGRVAQSAELATRHLQQVTNRHSRQWLLVLDREPLAARAVSLLARLAACAVRRWRSKCSLLEPACRTRSAPRGANKESTYPLPHAQPSSGRRVLEVGDDVCSLLRLLEAGEHHLGACISVFA